MSVRIDATAPAQTITRPDYNDNKRSRSPVPSGAEPKSAEVTPERAAALTRQLEERLNTDIARIRQRVDTPDATASPPNSTGRILDIRA